jgi:hypothetical protein
MQNDPVVTMTMRAQSALRASQDAEDREDAPEVVRLGRLWVNLLYAERETAPTSNAGAGQKMRNIRREPDAGSKRFARSASRMAATIERGDITPLLLRAMRALMPAALRHDIETRNGGATAQALMHAIHWCARLRLVG